MSDRSVRTQFSPHTRGRAQNPNPRTGRPPVFPAHAGMSRGRGTGVPVLPGFPRTRGDEPRGHEGLGDKTTFSPHTRG